LLGLGKAWRVVEARLEASAFVLKVEETPDLWPEESARAGTPVTCYDHVEPMQWRHLNVFNKECVIVCALPAYSDANRTPIRFEVGQRSDSKRTAFRLKPDSRPG
jgi:hypothetical protein